MGRLEFAFVRRRFEVAFQGEVGMVREEFVLQMESENPIGAKIAHIPAQAAIGDQVPVVRVVNQAQRFDLTLGDFAVGLPSSRSMSRRRTTN